MLTISKLKRWSINYYNETAKARPGAKDLQRANGGLGEYYSEHETCTPVWLLGGDKVGEAPAHLRRCVRRITERGVHLSYYRLFPRARNRTPGRRIVGRDGLWILRW